MKNQQRKLWNNKEDKILKEIVTKRKIFQWNLVAQTMKNEYKITKTPKQCRERYSNHLGPEINKNNWSIEENNNLINMHTKYGNHWTVISNYVTGRTENNIKNQFFSLLKKSLRKLNKATINNKEYMNVILKIKPKTISLFINLKFYPNEVTDEIKQNSLYFKNYLLEFIENNEELSKNRIKNDCNNFRQLIESLMDFDKIIKEYKTDKRLKRENIKIEKKKINHIDNLIKEDSINTSNKSKIIKKKITKIRTNFNDEESNLNDIDIEGIFTKSIQNKFDNYFNFFNNNSQKNIINVNQEENNKPKHDPYSINSTNKNKKFFILNDNSIINNNINENFFQSNSKIQKNYNMMMNENISSVIKNDNNFFK